VNKKISYFHSNFRSYFFHWCKSNPGFS